MGKAEKGTPKDLANRMKAKGLQKLRWYCQMCQKQCRDENGFKCHTMSESHQRQLLLFADNPESFLDSFSEEFLEGYLGLLKRRFGTKRVHANNVYQEYIQDRDHVHMNATQWETLTDFVKWLGREGHCVVDETEKGWYVTYIDRDPETLRRQAAAQRRQKAERGQEERMQDFIQRQIELGRAKDPVDKLQGDEAAAALQREDGATISLTLKAGPARPRLSGLEGGNALKIVSGKQAEKVKKDTKKRTALDEIMEEEMKGKKSREESTTLGKEKSNSSTEETRDLPWVIEDIIVKVVTKDLGSKYYKQKGIVKEVVGKYAAIVRLLDCNTKLKLDQTHLETVIPSVGRAVLVVAGPRRGSQAMLHSIQEESFSATLDFEGQLVPGIPYEQFSKLVPS
ncbi:DNA/RNA-binding protein KIN17-like [Portunus trituberculatus]|uniref:DNA/RNA-binding protein KIN17 n=1 Tax=Portunus trituberculatus TaxID=210409 RepID=A0A5B7CJW8_PORTR|nr:DNA/RNA-binding protein KIN17-like [Portunus trituberculatus]XP_045138154.1 DNA/RNA-binding protein KIN17-like [Portunus trituberculatus]XP_045138155.1 DNA/RNA-binding protein KIN17-like [Portunus trituberculatus]XP_045138156.1 DNA/RNA-binding protein KIN17-like [Portunus trituberculatus]MPC09907.1 DNA/RNA-binding protein KIN17 [Portunus trituberculatus]